MGQRFAFSVTDFNIALGFVTAESARSHDYLNSCCDFSADFEPVSLYRSWTQNSSLRYNPSTSKDTYIVDAALKCVHRFLAYSFSGRKDSASVLSKAEFFFLWCMSRSIKVNLGCWLATQFGSVAANKRPLILGSLITHLAVQLHLISLEAHDLHLACEMQPLDMTCLLGMGLVGQHNGEFHFCPPGPLVPRKARVVHDRGATSSDSPSPTSSFDEDTARSTTVRLRRLEQRLSRMEKNLMAYFHHVGFTPHTPPSP
ncbi:hypothetical protein CDL12_30547 [Handroanthus impetiginosus]|uniref:Uncharacterized protein n=1 Tax=Handroanthus impetiginosus TaxID=429701 RepID=A0A2G9FV86_9LAMI|nr:hypothetical protein CDL12_30547 [Handroanthus impetiginosus]